MEAAENIFMRKGFYKTTVDELARALKMSKKTIYKYFPSKQKLVEAIVEDIKANIGGRLEVIVKSDANAVRKLYDFTKFISQRTQKISGPWLEDLQAHGTELWRGIEKFRRRMILDNMSKIITSGQKEGVFEPYPPILIINIFLSAVEGVAALEFLINTNISAHTAVTSTIRIVMNGILTAKGRRMLKQIKEKTDEKF